MALPYRESDDDYVASILERQKQFCGMLPNEDMFRAPIHFPEGNRLVLSDSSNMSLPQESSSPGKETSMADSIKGILDSFMSTDNIICSPGNKESDTINGISDIAMKLGLDPFDDGSTMGAVDRAMFYPAGGALAVELRSVGPLIRLNHECDPFVTCGLYSSTGARQGELTEWPRRYNVTHPTWRGPATRFVGPAGYICRPGDYLEFCIHQEILGGGEIVGVARLNDIHAVVPLDNDTEERDAEVSFKLKANVK